MTSNYKALFLCHKPKAENNKESQTNYLHPAVVPTIHAPVNGRRVGGSVRSFLAGLAAFRGRG